MQSSVRPRTFGTHGSDCRSDEACEQKGESYPCDAGSDINDSQQDQEPRRGEKSPLPVLIGALDGQKRRPRSPNVRQPTYGVGKRTFTKQIKQIIGKGPPVDDARS